MSRGRCGRGGSAAARVLFAIVLAAHIIAELGHGESHARDHHGHPM
ncbi:hypothetical protein [Microbispora sp. NPDC049125]